MTERVLNIIRKQSKKVFCIFDGLLLDELLVQDLENLVHEIEKLGSIRKNIVVFSRLLKPEEHQNFIKRGFSPIVVSAEKDIYLTLECLEVVNKQQLDLLCLGVVDDTLLPVIIDIRAKTEILLVSPTREEAEKYQPYLDYLITLDKLRKTN